MNNTGPLFGGRKSDGAFLAKAGAPRPTKKRSMPKPDNLQSRRALLIAFYLSYCIIAVGYRSVAVESNLKPREAAAVIPGSRANRKPEHGALHW